MTTRQKVERKEIENLWGYYFLDAPSSTAKKEKDKIDVAVLTTEQRVLLRYSKSDQDAKTKTEKLREIGGFLTGTAIEFGQMFKDEVASLTFDTEIGNTLYIIPFRTQSEDEKVVDAYIVLYGKNISFMAYKFDELSRFGWKEVSNSLTRE